MKRKPRLPTSALTGALASTETADVANFAAQVVCQADTVFAGTVFFAATAWVIRPARSRYGPRPRWGQIEYAQVAIIVLHPKGLPQNFNASQLTEDVRNQLAKDPAYCAIGFKKPVSRMTVLRAVAKLREANEPA